MNSNLLVILTIGNSGFVLEKKSVEKYTTHTYNMKSYKTKNNTK